MFNVPIDIVWSDSDLSRYDLVIAPMLHMVKPDLGERIEAFVEQGGSFVATVFSGVVDESDLRLKATPARCGPCWVSKSRRSTRCTRGRSTIS